MVIVRMLWEYVIVDAVNIYKKYTFRCFAALCLYLCWIFLCDNKKSTFARTKIQEEEMYVNNRNKCIMRMGILSRGHKFKSKSKEENMIRKKNNILKYYTHCIWFLLLFVGLITSWIHSLKKMVLLEWREYVWMNRKM